MNNTNGDIHDTSDTADDYFDNGDILCSLNEVSVWRVVPLEQDVLTLFRKTWRHH